MMDTSGSDIPAHDTDFRKDVKKRARSARCNSCEACKTPDCGLCPNCLDKKAFGGPGIKKQACARRKCIKLQSASQDTGADRESLPAQDENVDATNVLMQLQTERKKRQVDIEGVVEQFLPASSSAEAIETEEETQQEPPPQEASDHGALRDAVVGFLMLTSQPLQPAQDETQSKAASDNEKTALTAKRLRAARCGTCLPCQRQDCGSCRNCLDKPKYGGPGVKKQACKHRKCIGLQSRVADEDELSAAGTHPNNSPLLNPVPAGRSPNTLLAALSHLNPEPLSLEGDGEDEDEDEDEQMEEEVVVVQKQEEQTQCTMTEQQQERSVELQPQGEVASKEVKQQEPVRQHMEEDLSVRCQQSEAVQQEGASAPVTACANTLEVADAGSCGLHEQLLQLAQSPAAPPMQLAEVAHPSLPSTVEPSSSSPSAETTTWQPVAAPLSCPGAELHPLAQAEEDSEGDTANVASNRTRVPPKQHEDTHDYNSRQASNTTEIVPIAETEPEASLWLGEHGMPKRVKLVFAKPTTESAVKRKLEMGEARQRKILRQLQDHLKPGDKDITQSAI